MVNPKYTPTPTLKTICGWCACLMRDGVLPISHGLCASCQSKLHAELDAAGVAR